MRRSSSALLTTTLFVAVLLLTLFLGTLPVQAASWTEVSTGGGIDGNFEPMQTAVSSTATLKGRTYFGTEDAVNGCEVWETDGTSWSQISSGGFGDPNNVEASSMAVLGTDLYVGTRNSITGCEVWMYSGSGWTQVNPDGFGSAANTEASCMEVHTTGDGLLYVGTANATSGCEVYQFLAPMVWAPVAAGGFGYGFMNTRASSMADYQGNLYVGTENAAMGCQVHYWNSVAKVFTELVGLWAGAMKGPGFNYGSMNTDCSVIKEYTGGTGFLYFGTESAAGCQVHEFTGLAAPAWAELVGPAGVLMPPGFAIPGNNRASSMEVMPWAGSPTFPNCLFLGVENQASGCELWCYTGPPPAPNAWLPFATFGGGIAAGPGLGDPANTDLACMELDPNTLTMLYLGTENAGESGCQVYTCDQLNSMRGPVFLPGFTPNNSTIASSMAVYKGEVYVGTRSGSGCQVWRYDVANTVWAEMVGPSGSGFTGPGFGDYRNLEASSMAVVSGVGFDDLYVGTWNQLAGCEVYKFDGTNWSQVGTGGLGDANNFNASAMAAFGGSIYVGTSNVARGCEVWEYQIGTSSWSQVNASGFDAADNTHVMSLAEDKSSLYAGTYNASTGAEVWRYDGPPNHWTQVGDAGFDGAGGNVGASSMALWRGMLYVGTENSTVAEVWRYEGIPNAWTLVGDSSVWKPHNVDISSLVTYDNGYGEKLYAGTWDGTAAPTAGCEVFSYDGDKWSLEGTGGLGNTDNFAATAMVVNGYTMYVGTRNDVSGCRIYETHALPPTVTGITPAAGYGSSTVHATIDGDGFQTGTPIVKLKRVGETEIDAINATRVSRTQITCDFNLTGAGMGAYDVYMENPDGQSDTLAGAFTVYPPMVNSVSPNHADPTGPVGVSVGGAGFWVGEADPQVRLTRAGRTPIEATGESFVSDKQINSSISLTGAEPGAWNVVVENPDHSTYQLTNGFYIGKSPIAAWGSDAYSQIYNTPTDPDFVAMDGGYYHIIGLKSNGTIAAWGNDDYGQVRNTPTDSDFVAVAAGGFFNLGLHSDGSIEAWGADNNSQVSNAPAGTGYVAITSGESHALAVKSDGTIVAWGRDVEGTVSNAPTDADFVAVAAGTVHCLGLRSDGTIAAWGWDISGSVSNTPTGSGFVALAAGGNHGMGLKSDGSIVSWGSLSSNPSPNTGFVAVAAGNAHSLGLRSDGSIAAWGDNTYGQLNIPEPNTGYAAVACGDLTSLALYNRYTVDASVSSGHGTVDPASQQVAWGGTATIDLASDPYYYTSITDNSVPVAFADPYVLSNVKEDHDVVVTYTSPGPAVNSIWPNHVSNAGGTGSTLVTIKGGCFQSGANVRLTRAGRADILPDADEDAMETEINCQFDFAGVEPGAWNVVVENPDTKTAQLTIGLYVGDSSAVAWGDNSWNQLNIPAPNSGFVDVAGGFNHSLGLKWDGSIAGWGENASGQLNVSAPNSGFRALAAGAFHSLGLRSYGSIAAWGDISLGQCNVPAPNSNFVAVAGGTAHSIGLKSDGSIVAWGYNLFGQLNIPAPNSGFVAVAAGGYHNLGLKSDGSIVAWGHNTYGQCNVPAPNTGFVAVAAGFTHSLGLKSDGTIVAWGRSDSGQLNVPAPNTGFVAMAGGTAHSIGLKSDGSIVAWGDNTYGQTTVPAPNLGYTAVAAGRYHSLALCNRYSVDASVSGGHGGVDPASLTLAWGGTASIELEPDLNYHVASITDNGEPQALNDPYVINNVKEDHAVVVTYVPIPVINSITPDASKINGLVTIAGTGFGATRGTSKVRFGDVVATYYQSWSDTQVVCKVPPGTTGALSVTVTTTGGASNPYAFKVLPRVTKLTPKYGVQGATITVKGSGFGATRGTSYIKFGTLKATTYVSWTATEIQVKVPAGASGLLNLSLTTAGGVSNLQPFKVTPKITKIAPTRGPVGTTVTITGTGFGASRGSSTVKFGITAVANYVSWSNTQIVVKVPTTGAGAKAVVVNTSGGKSNGLPFTVQ